MGYDFCTKTKQLRKLQVSKVKALRFLYSYFLRENKFETAEVSGKLQCILVSQTLCLKYIDNCSVAKRIFYWSSLLQDQIRRQEAKLKRFH